MSLKDNWIDRQNGVDNVDAEDINKVARAVIEVEERLGDGVIGGSGTTFYPSVSPSGIISWTNDGGLPNPTPINIKGSPGEKGEKGDTGAAGKDGANGKDGTSVTVASVSESTSDGENNVVTFSDGKTLTVKNGSKGSKGADGFDGKTAYQYAQDGGYTGTETEFAKKLAQERFANPNSLTFTGAVIGSYDGSAPMEVAIPSTVTDDHINSLIDTKLGVIENGSY